MGFFSSLFGDSDAGKATQEAAIVNKGLLKDLKPEGMGYINTGADQAAGYLNDARNAYAPLASLGQQGSTMYANAVGLNGQPGNDAASAAFQAGPGYQWALDQGLGALERRASAQGRLQSGQTGLDTINYATGLASQEYGNWLDRLSPYNQMYGAAIQGQTAPLSSLADLSVGTGDRRLNLAGSVTSGLMGANNQWAQGKEANTAAQEAALPNLIGTIGKVAGMASGYGGFGGTNWFGGGSSGFGGGGLW